MGSKIDPIRELDASCEVQLPEHAMLAFACDPIAKSLDLEQRVAEHSVQFERRTSLWTTSHTVSFNENGFGDLRSRFIPTADLDTLHKVLAYGFIACCFWGMAMFKNVGGVAFFAVGILAAHFGGPIFEIIQERRLRAEGKQIAARLSAPQALGLYRDATLAR